MILRSLSIGAIGIPSRCRQSNAKRRGIAASHVEQQVAQWDWTALTGPQSRACCYLRVFRILQGPNQKPYAAGWIQNLPNPMEIARMLAPVLNASSPPTIAIHGDADPTVPYTQSVRLHEALKSAHVKEQMITIPGGKHGGFTRAENERAFAAIEAFLKGQNLWPAK